MLLMYVEPSSTKSRQLSKDPDSRFTFGRFHGKDVVDLGESHQWAAQV